MDAESLRAFSGQAAEVGEALWPALIRIGGGAALEAAVTEPRKTMALIDGGDTDRGPLVVRVRKEVLAVAPALQAVLEWKREVESVWRPEKYRIDEVTANEVDAAWTVRCVPLN